MTKELVNHSGKLDLFYFMPNGAVMNPDDSPHLSSCMESQDWQYRN